MSNKTKLDEQKRQEFYNKICNSMRMQGYTKHDETISVLKANIMAFVTAGPIAVICFFIFQAKWNVTEVVFDISSMLVFLGLFMFYIFAHELLHGATWAMFCKDGWQSIHLGMMWSSFTPYCSCKEPLKFTGYIVGGLMPLFILGILGFTAAYFTGNMMLFHLSLVNILAAGGDTTIALMLLKYRNACIVDHPTKCGFVAFIK